MAEAHSHDSPPGWRDDPITTLASTTVENWTVSTVKSEHLGHDRRVITLEDWALIRRLGAELGLAAVAQVAWRLVRHHFIPNAWVQAITSPLA
jgi:hypothetical protein